MRRNLAVALGTCALCASASGQSVSTAAALIEAVTNGPEGASVELAPGVYELTEPLRVKAGVSIRGAGAGETTIRSAAEWVVGNAGLPDNAVNHTSVNRDAYLLDLGDGAAGVTVSGLTLSGPGLHGAIYCNDCDGLTIEGNVFDDFLWSAVRLFRVNDGLIADNDFIDAGGRANVDSGVTGGAIFVTFTTATDIRGNRFTKTPDHPGNFFGVKGRKATDTRIFENTINVSFSIEFPFENDERVQIFHNFLDGVVSVPKFAGGPAAALGESFHVYENYFTRTYSIEGPRNGLLVERNLFDFSTEDDGGNLVSSFGGNGSPVTPGPTALRDNNIRNPGRGVFWSGPIYNGVEFARNHVIADTTATPRTEGFLGFKLSPNNEGDAPDLASIAIRDNIFEVSGLARPLVRGAAADKAAIAVENNTLTNISDAADYPNPDTGAPRGPSAPLGFRVGVGGEFTVEGFTIRPTFCGPADIDGSGGVTFADVTAFISLFNASDADINGDGVTSFADVTAFIQAFNAGCP